MVDIGYLHESGRNALQECKCFGLTETEYLGLMEAAMTWYAEPRFDQHHAAQIISGVVTGDGVMTYGIERPYFLDDPLFDVVSKKTVRVIKATEETTGQLLGPQLAKSNSLQQAVDFVKDALAGRVSKILHIAEEDIDTSRPVHSYGIDSLVAVEIRNWILKEVQADVSLFEILSSVPLATLAYTIAERSKLVPQVAVS